MDDDFRELADRFMKVNYHSSSLLHHTSNLFQLSRFGFVNAYLFAERDRTFTLIDTGIISFGHEIIKEAGKLDRPVARIVLTHVHADHAGSLDYLTRKSVFRPFAGLNQDERWYRVWRTASPM